MPTLFEDYRSMDLQVRCVYPKKVTYVFLPLPEEKEAKTPVFSCLPNKVHLFSPEDTVGTTSIISLLFIA